MRIKFNLSDAKFNFWVLMLAVILTASSILAQQLQSSDQERPAESQSKITFSELYWQGLTQLQAGHADSAVSVFEQALQMKPGHSKAQINLARSYLKAKEFEKAQKVIEEVLASDSTNADAHLVYGRVLQNTGKKEEAIEAYETSVDLREDNPYAYNNLGLIYLIDRDYESALTNLEKAVEQKEDIAFFHNNLGMAYEGLNEFQKARGSFRTAIEIDANHTKAQANLDRVERLLGVKKGTTVGTPEPGLDATQAILSDEQDYEFSEQAEMGLSNETDILAQAEQTDSRSNKRHMIVRQMASNKKPQNAAFKLVGALAVSFILAAGFAVRNHRRPGYPSRDKRR